MKRFYSNLIILSIPFFCYYGFVFFVLLKSGELYNINKIINARNDKLLLFGPAYTNPDKYYKLNTTRKYKPKLLALGTSRIMQIRSCFFKHPAKFYNAGGAVDRISLYEDFVKQFQSSEMPEILIISCDQFHYNPNWINNLSKIESLEYPNSINIPNIFIRVFINAQKLYIDLLSNKIKLASIGKSEVGLNKIGLSACFKKSGFKNDGSYYYGNIIEDANKGHDYNFENTLERIKIGKSNFEYSNNVSTESLSNLNSLLELCNKKNIYVIGFLPPYAPSIFSKMKESGNYEYIVKLPSLIDSIFTKNNFSCYDFTNMTGCSDNEFIDGFHGSERIYLKIILSIAEREENLKKHIDNQYLHQRLMTSNNPKVVFQFSE